MKKIGKVLILSTSILVAAQGVPYSPFETIKAEASSSIKLNKTTYQTTDNVNLRTGASTKNKAIITIPKGKIVTATAKTGAWYKVSYTYSLKGKNITKTGWVSGSYIKEYYKYTTITKSYYFSKSQAKLYPTPDTKKKAAYTISGKNGFYSTQKVVNSLGQTWYRISYNGKTLYINSSSVNKNSFASFTKTKYKANKDTYLYQSYGTIYNKLVKIPKGTIVQSTKRIGEWYSVTYGGKSGYFYIGDFSKYNEVTYTYSNTSTTYYFTKNTAKLYLSPKDTKKEEASLSSNNGFLSTQKVVNSLGETWYRVDEKDLYVSSKDVVKDSFKDVPQTKYKANMDTFVYQSFGNSYDKLVSIPKDTIVTATSRIGDWYKVIYNGTSGYFYIGDFSPYNEISYEYTNTNKTYYFTKQTTKLYSYPNSSGNEVYSIAANNGFTSTQKIVNSLGETWYRVDEYNGKTLYVNSKDVSKNTFSDIQTEYKANKDTYVYQSFGNAYNKLIKIPKDTIVSPNKKIGDWYSVTYNGTAGYFYIGDFSPYTNVTESKIQDTTFVTTADLNLRKTADASSNLLITIPNSKIVVATAKVSNGWYKVSYGGKTGYVNGSYLKEVKTGDPITSRTGYQFIDLRTQSPVTAKQINDYISKYVNSTGKISVLTGKGQAFINAGKKYGVNALYLAAHAIHESAYGTSNISLGKNNLFGFGAYDATPFVAAYRFATVDLNIEYIAREMKATYLNENNWKYNGPYLGFSTKDLKGNRIDSNSEGMNFYYASDQNWGKTIAKHMENILPFDKNYYSKAVANTVVPTQPSKPDGSDVFPTGIQAVANQDLVLNSKKGINDAVKKIKKNSKFFLLEKANDFWVKVMVDDKIYWTNDINFVSYKKYLSVQNLGRVTAASLNVRTAPNSTIIGALNLNDYVQIVLQKDGTPTMDSTKTWYQVTLANGKTGWISATYVVQELK
ncbi:SH3 domain-containing protein [Heyndrickxia sp. NPDC080065]|uniref:SH3 domain-containing protein n=1 Tax=Heyndrickxia sp. NPDC080065 TaxID=3390568 RepID=UPI003D02FAC2